jgi:PKD repeat protein
MKPLITLLVFVILLGCSATESSAPISPPSLTVGVASAAPVADYTVRCRQQFCHFDASTSTDDVGIVSYEWDFADGSTAVTGDPLIDHVYAAKGWYVVYLTVRDADGNSTTVATGANVKSFRKT